MSETKKFFDELEAEFGPSPERDIHDELVSLAVNVARIRREKGLSQATLAEQMGTSQPRIAEIESAQGNPTYRTLVRLAHALDVPIETLVAGQRHEMEDVAAYWPDEVATGSCWLVAANSDLAAAA